eukprot:TRINITY_DN12599_c0_g1_i1.p6 TRINITY_DN12599_c0_g1~~TRINITY_DN12599_c0_g1_i1.p6  ORF type:complete len:128 (+),score=36.33 TRINITY_DN12599_c0_g1_i1:548-931(+)
MVLHALKKSIGSKRRSRVGRAADPELTTRVASFEILERQMPAVLAAAAATNALAPWDTAWHCVGLPAPCTPAGWDGGGGGAIWGHGGDEARRAAGGSRRRRGGEVGSGGARRTDEAVGVGPPWPRCP